jgi:UDP-3-O-[3-hydroxymyristoyl] glucosamine N-acyltransferase
VRIKQIAELLESEVIGDPDFEINSISEIKDARKGDLVFFFKEKKINEVEGLENLAAVVPESVKECFARSWIKVKDVKGSMVKILKSFYPPSVQITREYLTKSEDFTHVKMGKNVEIGGNVFIGNNCILGNGVNIFPFSYIGNNVEIGDNGIIYPHVVVLDGTTIGRDVKIYTGAVIGSEGFGYRQVGDRFEAIPHIGRVVVGDNVDIGALTMIDRGTIGDTVIGDGTKIDNSVHIAHNVKIGKNVIVMAQTGVAGSCELEDNVVVAGQVGISDHIKIGKNAKIAAKSGVIRNIEEKECVFGYPADNKISVMRSQVYLRKLPEIFKKVKDFERSKRGF